MDMATPVDRKKRLEQTHQILQTRVPQEVYDRIKLEAAERKMSLAKFLTTLVDEQTNPITDMNHLKTQWTTEGWVDCAGWLLAKFREQGFCNIDLRRLEQWLSSHESLWPQVRSEADHYAGQAAEDAELAPPDAAL